MTAAPSSGARPQRILQVAWGFEPFGGMERHVTELSLALVARGHSVALFLETPAPAANAYLRRLRRGGVPVSGAGVVAGFLDRLGKLPLGRARATLSAPIRSRHSHPVTRDLFRRLADAVERARPDVLHVHGTRLRQAWVIDWAHARGIPTVYTEHVTLDEREGAVDLAAIETMRTRLGVMACVSERSRASLRSTLGDDWPVEVMRHVVSGPDEVQAHGGGVQVDPSPHSTSPLNACCVARLEHYKGIDVLLHALALVRARGLAVTMRILGDGSQRAALEAQARSLDLSDVHFAGAVAPELVGATLQESELVILPSRGEGLPLAIVEAMAHGRPVLATRVGGNAEVVDEGVTGVLVAPEQPDALANAIVRLASDRAALRRMGAAARRAWETGGWTPDLVVAHALRVYGAAAARRDAR